MKTAGMGPERQIRDNSYYLQLLRAKCTEIMQEISKLKGNVEQGQKDNAAYGQLERKYETLTNEMRRLQGQLADYNLLLDRTRAHREADEVLEEAQRLSQTNAADRQRVDELFQHRTALEAQGRDVEHQLMRLHHEMAEKLEAVDPEMKAKFLTLTNKQQVLSVQELPKRHSDLAFFDERVREMEAVLSRDPTRSKAMRLREELMRLERLHQTLSQEMDGPQLSEEEQREMLLARVKADNAQIAENEKLLSEAQEAIRAGKKRLANLANEMSEANDPKAKKYEELFARDKEMSELIDSFDTTKATELKKIELSQEEVVKLLQSISRKMAMQDSTDAMTDDRLAEMKSDLDFKQNMLDHSVTTSEKLQRELTQRKVELEKIETLDEKILTELAQLSEKLSSMNAELQTYDDIPKLREMAEDQKSKAQQSKAEAESKIGALKQRSAEAKKHYDELKAKLSGDELATSLDELEGQMKHHMQTVYVLTEYIETKGAESIFEPIAEECLNLLQGINTESIRVLRDRPVFSANQFQPY
uniref:Uncharacterized protein n=1 Tax=Haptolina brevifila TaxID=156173 RepID=A0A7S2FJH9_9EUKA